MGVYVLVYVYILRASLYIYIHTCVYVAHEWSHEVFAHENMTISMQKTQRSHVNHSHHKFISSIILQWLKICKH